MDFKKDKWEIGVIIILTLAIVFFGYNYLQNKAIKQANINGYAFLEEISQCDITYEIDVSGGGISTGFKKECLENAAKNLRGISFKPGEKGDKFILESREYLNCSDIRDTKGSEAFRNCIKDILPILEEKYPEVNQAG